MTLVASLLFVTALAASISVIMLTVRNAMPRIVEIVEAEFAPAMAIERKIVVGAVKWHRPVAAEVIAFPARTTFLEPAYKLAA